MTMACAMEWALRRRPCRDECGPGRGRDRQLGEHTRFALPDDLDAARAKLRSQRRVHSLAAFPARDVEQALEQLNVLVSCEQGVSGQRLRHVAISRRTRIG